MSKGKEVLKIILYWANLLNLFTKLRYHTYRLLKGGYDPRKFWDGWSDNYSSQKAQQRIDKSQYWLLKKVEELRPKNVLEIGCGFGRNLEFLLEHLSYPAAIVGFDISESMIRKAKRDLNNQVLFGCADITALPFYEESYDLVFTHATLMHVPEQNIRKAIEELQRVTKQYLIIIEETYWSLRDIKGATFKPNEYTFIYDYARLLSECGLKIIEMKEEKGDWNLIYFLCSKKESPSR